MSGQLQPIDRLDYAVLALEGLNDLVAAAPNLQDVQTERLAALTHLITGEIRSCAEELRRRQ